MYFLLFYLNNLKMCERKNHIFYLNIHFATPWNLPPGAALKMAFCPGYAPQIEILEEGSGLWNKPYLELDVELKWSRNLLEKTGTFFALSKAYLVWPWIASWPFPVVTSLRPSMNHSLLWWNASSWPTVRNMIPSSCCNELNVLLGMLSHLQII